MWVVSFSNMADEGMHCVVVGSNHQWHCQPPHLPGHLRAVCHRGLYWAPNYSHCTRHRLPTSSNNILFTFSRPRAVECSAIRCYFHRQEKETDDTPVQTVWSVVEMFFFFGIEIFFKCYKPCVYIVLLAYKCNHDADFDLILQICIQFHVYSTVSPTSNFIWLKWPDININYYYYYYI